MSKAVRRPVQVVVVALAWCLVFVFVAIQFVAVYLAVDVVQYRYGPTLLNDADVSFLENGGTLTAKIFSRERSRMPDRQ